MRGIVTKCEILLSWLSEEDDHISYVDSEGVWRSKYSGDQLRGKEELYQFNSPVVSVWMDPTTGYLFAASPESIQIVTSKDWRLKYEHKLTDSRDKGGTSEMWLCSVPGTWLPEYTNNVTITRPLIVLVIEKKLTVLDVKTRKTWTRMLPAHQPRGQFLAQFISLCIPDVHVTSLVGAVSLLTRSLTCQFLQSEIRDVQFAKDIVIVITSEGKVWRLQRLNLDLSQKCLISNGRTISVSGNYLNVLTLDGALYRFDLKHEDDALLESETRGQGIMESAKNLNISKRVKEQAASLEKLSDDTISVDMKIRQLQNYHNLYRCSKGDITKLLTFSAVADPRQGSVVCQLKLNTLKISIEGKFWCFKVELLNEKEEVTLTKTSCFPKTFTSSHDPIMVNIFPCDDQLPRIVKCHLIFKTNLVSQTENNQILPPIALRPVTLNPLDFLMITSQNIGGSFRRSDEELFCENLDDSEAREIRVEFKIRKNDLDLEGNKIHSVIAQSVKNEISLSILKIQVRIKSDIVKKGNELAVTLGSTNGNILNMLESASHVQRQEVKILTNCDI